MNVAVSEGVLSTLVLDDGRTFVEFLQSKFLVSDLGPTRFATSIEEGKRLLHESQLRWDRIVADLVFEQESENGLVFLEHAHRLFPDSDLILLTGKRVEQDQLRRLRSIRGRLVRKPAITTELMRDLVRGNKSINWPAEVTDAEADVGEIKLKLDALVDRFNEVTSVNDLLIEDIVAELDSLEPNKKALFIGTRRFSADELKQEVLSRSELGIKIIRLHHDLYRTLRGR